MDLSTLKIDNEPATLELRHPTTGDKLDIKIHCVGMDSEQFKTIDRQLAKKRLLDAQKRGGLKKAVAGFDFDEIENDDLQRLAACITGWENVTENEQALKFSREAAVDVMRKYPWIKDQIADFIGDRANFIKAS